MLASLWYAFQGLYEIVYLGGARARNAPRLVPPRALGAPIFGVIPNFYLTFK